MSAWSEKKFAAIQRRFRAARAREESYRAEVLLDKYWQTRPPSSWLTRTERGKLDTFDRTQDRAIEAMTVLLDQIGGRDWRRGAPVVWIMTELAYEDAVTVGGLSVLPPVPYGCTTRDVERFAAPARFAAGGRR